MPWSRSDRAAQAARIKQQKPWLHATGPRTDAGKSRSSRNADKGLCTRNFRDLAALLRQMEHATPGDSRKHRGAPSVLNPP